MNIGLKIKQKRKDADLTQSQLAELSGVAVITIRQYESNKRQPRADQLRAIASALGVTVDYLLGLDDEIQRAKEAAANVPDDTISDVEEDDLAIFDRVCQLTGHYARPKLDDLSGYYLGKNGEKSAEVFLTNKEFRALIKRIAATTTAIIDSEIETVKDNTTNS